MVAPRSLRAVPETANDSPILTVSQLHALLVAHGVGWSEGKVYRLLEADLLPRARVGNGEYVIHRAEVLDWLANGRLNRWREPQAKETTLRLDPWPAIDALIDVLSALRSRGRLVA